jgi:polyhydroxyalkanoate synthesis regulator phasin
MPDQDNIQTEKISLDFSEDLGDNSFGIQDTQVLAGKDLQSFLLSNPDDIRDANQDDDTPPPVQKKEDKKIPPKKIENQEDIDTKDKNLPLKKDEKPDGKDTLDKLLYGDEDESTTTNNVDPKDAPQSSDDDTYSILAKDFLRLGVFTKNSDDETEESISVKTPEEFLERFQLEKKKGAINIIDNFLSQYGEEYRQMFDAVFVNGVKPQDYLQSFAKIEAISGLNLEDEANQERVVRAYYKGLKWEDTKIETRIQKLKDYGDLEDEAKTYQEVLLNKEKEQVAEIERKKQKDIQEAKDKEVAQKKSYHRILTEKLKTQEIDGIPLNDKEAQATLEYLTDKKYKLQSGELLSEFDKDLLELNRPENHELKVKLGLLLRKKLDLSSVKKTTISKKSDQLFTLATKNAKQNPKEKEVKSFF